MALPRVAMTLVVVALPFASCTDGGSQKATTTGLEQGAPLQEETLAEVDCGTMEHDSTALTQRFGAATVIATVAGSDRDVEVVDLGAEPRERLLFDLAAGDRLAVRVTQRVAVDPPREGAEAGEEDDVSDDPTDQPTSVISFVADVEVSEVTETEFVLVTALTELLTEGEAAEEIVAQAEDLESILIRETFSVSGSLIESQIATTTQPDPEVEAAFAGLPARATGAVSPFPDEWLGIGAVWRAELASAYQGLDTENLVEQTLTARDGTRVGIDFSTEQRIPQQQVGEATIEETVLRTTGSSVIALDHPGICRYEASSSGELTTTGPDGAVTEVVTIETTLEPAR